VRRESARIARGKRRFWEEFEHLCTYSVLLFSRRIMARDREKILQLASTR
jgi:hypothetical protein